MFCQDACHQSVLMYMCCRARHEKEPDDNSTWPCFRSQFEHEYYRVKHLEWSGFSPKRSERVTRKRHHSHTDFNAQCTTSSHDPWMFVCTWIREFARDLSCSVQGSTHRHIDAYKHHVRQWHITHQNPYSIKVILTSGCVIKNHV